MDYLNILEEISNFIFTSKYARYNERLKRRETWEEAVDRLEEMHLKKYRKLPAKDRQEIEWAFSLVRGKRVVPSMRSLQFGGKAIEAKNERMYNCCVRHVDSPRAFAEIFFSLLCGNGVGIGLSRHFLGRLPNLVDANDKTGTVVTYVIEDTIEGWADSIEALLLCYMKNTAYTGRKIVFDYSKIRKKGAVLKTGGGKAPGYKGLKNAHQKTKELLDYVIEERHQTRLRSIDAYDILMHCSDAVLSGGVRRSASSVIFDKDDEWMLSSKSYFKVEKKHRFGYNEDTSMHFGHVVVNGRKYYVEMHEKEDKYAYEKLQKENLIGWKFIEPQRARSNNSVLILRSEITLQEFKKIVERTKEFGEPGFVFADSSWMLYNPCFHKETRIATDDGLRRIYDMCLNGEENNVVTDNRILPEYRANYSEFGTTVRPASKVELTQKNCAIYKVKTEHGHSIKATSNHEFMTLDGKKRLEELEVGDYLLLQSAEGCFGGSGNYEQGLILGMITGDGTFTSDEAFIDIWQEDFGSLEDIQEIVNKQIKLATKESYRDIRFYNQTKVGNVEKKRIGGRGLFAVLTKLGIENPQSIKEKLPECIYRGSRDFVKGFIQGLVFSDGFSNVAGHGTAQTVSLRISQANEPFLLEIQAILQNFGITSRVYLRQPEGERLLPNSARELVAYHCKAGYELVINRPNLITFMEKIGLIGRKENLVKDILDKRGYSCRKPERFISEIKSIEYDCNDDVYCLKQPYSNSVIANGLAVLQCFEIGFLPVTQDGVCGMQMCNLTSINGRLVKRFEDYMECVKAATIIGTLQAGYTRFDYFNNAAKNLTEEESLLGVSITGMMDNPDILLNPGYQKKAAQYAIEINKDWAKKIGVNQAARITCIKPEGTSSLVLGCASGIHPHHARKYIRRVQCNKIDNVYKFFKKQNPELCEESIWSANKTDDIISFPIEVSDGTMLKADLSAIKHLEIIKSTQQNWVNAGKTEANRKAISHNVSCTVVCKDNEWDEVITYLFDNREFFSAVSLLGAYGDKEYKQAPMEGMATEEEVKKFEEMKTGFKHVDFTKMVENDDETAPQNEIVCAGGSCEIVRV